MTIKLHHQLMCKSSILMAGDEDIALVLQRWSCTTGLAFVESTTEAIQ